MTAKTTKTTTAKTATPKATPKPKAEPTTGPKLGKVARRKPNPKDGGHTLVEMIGPFPTKAGREMVTWTCECGHSLRLYGDPEKARASHARHVTRLAAPESASA